MHEVVGAKSNILLQNDSNEKLDIFSYISFDKQWKLFTATFFKINNIPYNVNCICTIVPV